MLLHWSVGEMGESPPSLAGMLLGELTPPHIPTVLAVRARAPRLKHLETEMCCGWCHCSAPPRSPLMGYVLTQLSCGHWLLMAHGSPFSREEPRLMEVDQTTFNGQWEWEPLCLQGLQHWCNLCSRALSVIRPRTHFP